MQVAEIIASVVGTDVPVRVIGYDGSKAGPDSRRAGAADQLAARARPAGHGARARSGSPGRT